MAPGKIKDGGDDEVCCLFWLFLRQSGAKVLRQSRTKVVIGAVTPIITVAIPIIGARAGETAIAGGDAGRISDLRLGEPQTYSPDYDNGS